MTTILPSAPPPRPPLSAARLGLTRLRVPALLVAIVVLALGAAAGARALTADRLPVADKPAGRELPLTTRVSLPSGLWAPGFRISLPQEPRVLAQPTTDPGATILSAPLGTPGSALLFGRVENVRDVQEAMDTLGKGEFRLGPTRHVSVAGRAAMTRDMFFGDKVVHEYRFDYEGIVFGFGIVTTVGDDVARDTGLAAMETFTLL